MEKFWRKVEVNSQILHIFKMSDSLCRMMVEISI